MPRVSVVIPTYNNEQYIRDTLRSVLSQTYDDFEVIIADHASLDSTQDIIDTFRTRSRVTILESTAPGGGAAANWNRVSRVASGFWIKLVCGDDLIDEDALAEQTRAVDENPSAVLIASQRRIIDANGRVLIAARGLGNLKGLVNGREAIRTTVRAGTNIFGEPACVLLRRDILESAGWWVDAHPYLLDESNYVNMLFHGDAVAIREPLASFRISATQWSVRLAKLQSDQAVSFHRSLREREPTLLSRTDVAVGDLRARVNALARRLIYVGLRKRLS